MATDNKFTSVRQNAYLWIVATSFINVEKLQELLIDTEIKNNENPLYDSQTCVFHDSHKRCNITAYSPWVSIIFPVLYVGV